MANEPIRCLYLVYHDLDQDAFEGIQAEAVSLVDEHGGLKIDTHVGGRVIRGEYSHKGAVYALPDGITVCTLANSDDQAHHGLYVKFIIASTIPQIDQMRLDLEERLKPIAKQRQTLFV
ncbi:MAG TPA: hypothetical protein VJC07_02915 [Candidatus Nanoarchaeia archaeon]|nr:hypothetical protein [Candidatus Nanoarchaeia archaeon]